jgi:hypothetical protein
MARTRRRPRRSQGRRSEELILQGRYMSIQNLFPNSIDFDQKNIQLNGIKVNQTINGNCTTSSKLAHPFRSISSYDHSRSFNSTVFRIFHRRRSHLHRLTAIRAKFHLFWYAWQRRFRDRLTYMAGIL